MTDLPPAAELAEAAVTDLLPPLPAPDPADNGWGWMAHLAGTGWYPVHGTRDGRTLGNWPYQIVTHHNDPERSLYGLAVYTEGDVSITGYRTKTARDQATDRYLEPEDDEAEED
ncbi:hypothetical protein ACFYMW_39110 [Streptomyces sp. NPDC006692]|uniref:hypothetical protein n=1 Tax=unclassified Streptomyces TaxID=2593676 RepID=UPI00369C9862